MKRLEADGTDRSGGGTFLGRTAAAHASASLRCAPHEEPLTEKLLLQPRSTVDNPHRRCGALVRLF